MDLVIIWACLVGLCIILYVVLDGFSLGIALIFPTAREEERDLLMNSIAPVWDMNQTWLVFGGGALLVAFPLIYGIAFSALYIPLLTFIFGLIFRGVTFEFRGQCHPKRTMEQILLSWQLSCSGLSGVDPRGNYFWNQCGSGPVCRWSL